MAHRRMQQKSHQKKEWLEQRGTKVLCNDR